MPRALPRRVRLLGAGAPLAAVVAAMTTADMARAGLLVERPASSSPSPDA